MIVKLLISSSAALDRPVTSAEKQETHIPAMLGTSDISAGTAGNYDSDTTFHWVVPDTVSLTVLAVHPRGSPSAHEDLYVRDWLSLDASDTDAWAKVFLHATTDGDGFATVQVPQSSEVDVRTPHAAASHLVLTQDRFVVLESEEGLRREGSTIRTSTVS